MGDDEGTSAISAWLIGVSIAVMTLAVIAITTFIIIKCCCKHEDITCKFFKTIKGSHVIV